jgi:uncharacterized protein YbjT (DUF2867 family)/transposase
MPPATPERNPTITITGANSSTGRRLLTCLATTPAHVTALVRQHVDLPAARVVEDWTRTQEAADAIGAADVVIHLSGVFSGPDWQTHHDGTVATAERVARALRPGQRLLYLSYTDADPDAANWYQRAKGLAEQALTDSPAHRVILRIPPIVHGISAPGAFERRMLPAEPGGPVTVIGDGTKRFQPLCSADLVDALMAACTQGRPGTHDLVGPDKLSVEQIVRHLNGPDITIKHLPVAAARTIPALPPTVIDLFTTPGREPDPVPTWRMLGLAPTPSPRSGPRTHIREPGRPDPCRSPTTPGGPVPALPSWLSAPLWDQFSALLPQRPRYHPDHPLCCHRPRINDRIVFDKLLQLLRFGCSYEAIADTTCSASTIRNHRDEWIRLGIFSQLKKIALESYDRIVGLVLDQIAIDGSITKAPAAARSPGVHRSTVASRA